MYLLFSKIPVSSWAIGLLRSWYIIETDEYTLVTDLSVAFEPIIYNPAKAR